MRSRTVLLLLAVLLLAALPLSARGRGHFGPRALHGGFTSGWDCGLYGYNSVFSPSVFSPAPFGYGYGGYGYYPAHFPVYPYPAPMVQHPQYVNVIMEATHDWRYWSPPTKVIEGPVGESSDLRVIGMGVPQSPSNNAEPLGDVARRYRELGAQSRSQQSALSARRFEQ